MSNFTNYTFPSFSWPLDLLLCHKDPASYLNWLTDGQCGCYFIPLWIIKLGILFLNVYQQTPLNLVPFHLCKLVNQREVWKNNMHAVPTEYDFKLPSFPEILISVEDIFISFGSYIAHKRTQLKCWSISQPQSVVTQESNIKPNYEVNLRLQMTTPELAQSSSLRPFPLK